MSRARRSDGVEAAMRKADETVEEWLRRGAGALRQQVDGLQVGLKKLSTGLEQLQRDRKTTASKPRRAAVARKPVRARKPKKAA